MKAIIFMFFFTLGTSTNSEFCYGFEAGWESYYDQNNRATPATPPCPTPTANEEDTYRAGFTRGVIEASRRDG